MASYSKPLPPRPANAARSKPLVSADFMAKQMGGQAPQPSQPQPPQAQGRSVVNQGGQQGVVGAGDNFQPLGAAALSRLPSPSPSPAQVPDPPEMQDFMARNPGLTPEFIRNAASGGGGNGVDGAGIEGAIGSLKQQLGMAPGSMPDADMATRPLAGLRAGITKQPYFGGDDGGEMQTYSRGIGGAPGSGPMPGPNPNGRRAPLNRGLNSAWAARQGGGVQPQQQQNPYAEILRQRLAANGGAGMGLGGGQFAY